MLFHLQSGDYFMHYMELKIQIFYLNYGTNNCSCMKTLTISQHNMLPNLKCL